jgi:hypothetical protein
MWPLRSLIWQSNVVSLRFKYVVFGPHKSYVCLFLMQKLFQESVHPCLDCEEGAVLRWVCPSYIPCSFFYTQTGILSINLMPVAAIFTSGAAKLIMQEHYTGSQTLC